MYKRTEYPYCRPQSSSFRPVVHLDPQPRGILRGTRDPRRPLEQINFKTFASALTAQVNCAYACAAASHVDGQGLRALAANSSRASLRGLCLPYAGKVAALFSAVHNSL
jgi:hypothetical protein